MSIQPTTCICEEQGRRVEASYGPEITTDDTGDADGP